MQKASAITIAGVSGLAMAQSTVAKVCRAQTISFTDERIKANYVDYPSPGGTSGEMRGYLVAPTGDGPHPCVLVIHENRGLNPYIEDVARRFAAEGFWHSHPMDYRQLAGIRGMMMMAKILQKSLDPGKTEAGYAEQR